MNFQLNDQVKIVGILEDLYEGWIWEIICIDVQAYPDARGSRTFYRIRSVFTREELARDPLVKSVQCDEISLISEKVFPEPFDFLKNKSC